MRRPALHATVAIVAGLVHAALILGIAIRYGYDVGPSAYTTEQLLWRYGGLVALGALPAWLALEDRLVAPLAILLLVGGFALVAEVTPPAPTFRDVSEIEPAIDEPTGQVVVDDGLHLVKYTTTWYVWTVGIALAGLWEHVLRARTEWLPSPRRSRWVPSDPLAAGGIALAAGLAHAVASLGYAAGWGMLDTSVSIGWIVAGAVALIAVPAYLLVRHDLFAPIAVGIALFLNSVHSQEYAGPSDPHGLYVGLWFVFLGLSLAAGGLELGVRRIRTAVR